MTDKLVATSVLIGLVLLGAGLVSHLVWLLVMAQVVTFAGFVILLVEQWKEDRRWREDQK